MKRYLVSGLVLFFVIAIIAILLPQELEAQRGNSGYIRRYAADHRTWASGLGGGPAELFTGLLALDMNIGPPGGLVIYDKTFFVAADINTLYVTISATGDTHDGAQMQLGCLVDRGDGAGLVACNPGGNPFGAAPPGWLTLQRHGPAGLTSTITSSPTPGARPWRYARASKGFKSYWPRMTPTLLAPPAVLIRTHVSPTGPARQRFLEGVHFYIDGSRIAGDNGSTDIDPTDGVGGPPCPDCVPPVP